MIALDNGTLRNSTLSRARSYVAQHGQQRTCGERVRGMAKRCAAQEVRERVSAAGWRASERGGTGGIALTSPGPGRRRCT